MNDLELMKKYLVVDNIDEGVMSVMKSLSFWKDALLIIQDISNLKSKKVKPDEKSKIVQKNIETLKYLLKKNRVSDLYVDMISAGLDIAMKHAGVRPPKTTRI